MGCLMPGGVCGDILRRDSCPQACHVQLGESACLLTCTSYTIDCPVPRKAQVREDFVRPAPGASVNSDGRKEGGLPPGTQVGGSRGIGRSLEGSHQVSWVDLIWVVVGFDYQAKGF